MNDVHLRPVTKENLVECIRLELSPEQVGFVANNAKSLAEAYVDSDLTPLAIYSAAARGFEKPPVPMVGFVMYHVEAGYGFVHRLMIDKRFQKQGYGTAAMIEVIRRMRLDPRVEMIGTCHRKENIIAAKMYQKLGFVPWDIEWAKNDPTETFLRLSE